MTGRLERVVDIAARRGLRVELTLFDWWHAYADVAGSRRWAAAVLSPYAGDARIAFVELKNELRPQDEGASAWAAALIPYVRELTRKPVTISVPALEPARDLGLLRSALGTAQPDFYSAHFYWRPELLAAHLDAARAAVAPVPLRLAETGYSTAVSYDIVRGVPASRSAREAQQAYYLRSVAAVARRLGLPPIAPWVLSDFSRDAIPPDDPGVYGNAREYRFGVFRVSGDGEARCRCAAQDLLGRPVARVQRRLRGRRPRRARRLGSRTVADQAGAQRGLLARRADRAQRPRLRPNRRHGRRDRARRRVRDRATRPGGRAGRPLDPHGVRARRHALRRGAGGAALVRGRPPRGRRSAVAAASLRWQWLATATCGRRGARRGGLRRHLSARGTDRRHRLVRRRSVRLHTRNGEVYGVIPRQIVPSTAPAGVLD